MDVDGTINRLFDRYDIDESGSLNSNDERQQLVLAILSKLGHIVHGDVIEQRLQQAGTLSDENAWDVAQFRAWFHEAFPPEEEEGGEASSFAFPRISTAAAAAAVKNTTAAAAAVAVDTISDAVGDAAEAVKEVVKPSADTGVDDEDAKAVLERLSRVIGEVNDKDAFTYKSPMPDPDKQPVLYYRWIILNAFETSLVQWAVIVAILANAICVGIEADYAWGGWIWVDTTFAVWFTFEIAFRLFARAGDFWFDFWSVFDFIVVVLSLVELGVIYHEYERQGNSYDPDNVEISVNSWSSFRILRLFRILKTMNKSQRLSTLIEACQRAFTDVLWVGLLGIIALYTSALIAKDIITESTLEDDGYSHPGYFGSVPITMATLLGMMTFDGWYTSIAAPIDEIIPGSFVFFIIFAVICGLGILNLLTAVFIDSIAAMQQKGVLQKVKLNERKVSLMAALMKEVFERCDTDGTGQLDKKEMQAALASFERPAYKTMFASLGVDLCMVESMLKHADADLDGKVNIDEFMESFEHMDKSVFKYQMWAVNAAISISKRKLATLQDHIDEQDAILVEQSKMLDVQSQQVLQLNSKLSELNGLLDSRK